MSARRGKRLFDVLVSALALVLAAPLLLAIALWVACDSPGPALFCQVRVGRHGVPFRIHKFRTMRVAASAEDTDATAIHAINTVNAIHLTNAAAPLQVTAAASQVTAAAPQVTADGDPRITRAGRLLRRTKLDELPQLWDVLRGRMSLVGPRPEVPRYVAHYPPELRDVVLSVRPGLTDAATLAYRHEERLLAAARDAEACYVQTVLPAKLRLAAAAVQSATFVGDLRTIARTVGALFR